MQPFAAHRVHHPQQDGQQRVPGAEPDQHGHKATAVPDIGKAGEHRQQEHQRHHGVHGEAWGTMPHIMPP